MSTDHVPRVAPKRGDDVTLDHQRRARLVAKAWVADNQLLQLPSDEINRLANADDEISEALDAIAVDRGRVLFGRGAGYSEEQLQILRNYLGQLAFITSRAIDEILRQRAGLSQKGPIPPANPYGVSHEGAELLVRDWMRHLGVVDAEVTRYSHDAGIDINSARFVAQVKHQAGNVGRPDAQQLVGAAVTHKKEPLFFTSASYTVDALTYANHPDIQLPLLHFDAERAVLSARNDAARHILEQA